MHYIKASVQACMACVLYVTLLFVCCCSSPVESIIGGVQLESSSIPSDMLIVVALYQCDEEGDGRASCACMILTIYINDANYIATWRTCTRTYVRAPAGRLAPAQFVVSNNMCG